MLGKPIRRIVFDLCRLNGVFLALVLLLLLVTNTALGFAQEQTSEPDVHRVPSVFSRLRAKRQNYIYQFENSDLGDRIPVILIPGRAEEYQLGVWWKNVYKKTKQDNFFEDHYKLYLFLYSSKEESDELTQRFIAEAKAFNAQIIPKRPVVWISYSLGGVIARDAMKDPELFNNLLASFAVATPFHGSPLFTPNWFIPHFKAGNHSPIRHILDHLLYRTYFLNKRNLTRGMHWDSFDGSGPVFSIIPEPTLCVDKLDCTDEETLAETRIKSKLFLYSSYLDNAYTLNKNGTSNPLTNLIKAPVILPSKIISFFLPSYLFSIHGVFNYMNQSIAQIPVVTQAHPKEKQTLRPFRYNDGAIPLSSQLYLPGRNRPYEGSLTEITNNIDVHYARIFPNIDHMDTGEYQRRHNQLITNDLLHPGQGKRTPIEWLLYDLRSIYPDNLHSKTVEEDLHPSNDEASLPVL